VAKQNQRQHKESCSTTSTFISKRKRRECIGCGDHMITVLIVPLIINRYLSPRNCSECDGSGIIKFRNHQPRPCKLCALTKKTMNQKTKNPLRLTAAEKY